MSKLAKTIKNKIYLMKLGPNELFSNVTNQIYQSKNDLTTIKKIHNTDIKIRILDRISNNNCKLVDFMNVLSVTNYDSKNIEKNQLLEKSINMIVNFFHEVNQDKEIYYVLKEMEKTVKPNSDERLFIIKMLKDFEIKSSINKTTQEQQKINELMIKIQELEGQFTIALLHNPKTIFLDLISFKKLPELLQLQLKENYLDRTPGITVPSGNIPMKMRFNDFSKLCVMTRDSQGRNSFFDLFFNFNKDSIPILLNLLNTRLNYAKLCGFNNYFSQRIFLFSMLSKMTDPPLKFANCVKTSNWRVEFIEKFIEKEINKARAHAKISLSDIFQIISVNTPLENIQKLTLNDIYYLNTKVSASLTQNGLAFKIDDFLHIISKVCEKEFDLRLEWHQVNDFHQGAPIKLIEINFIQLSTREIFGTVYLDLYRRNNKMDLNQLMLLQAATQLNFGTKTETMQKSIYYITLGLNIDANIIKNDELLNASISYEGLTLLVHELGHSFHHILSGNKFQFVSFDFDTDYSEIAAYIFEKLMLRAVNIQTYIDKYVSDKSNFILAYEEYMNLSAVLEPWRRLEQLFYAYIDLKFHLLEKDPINESDLREIYKKTLNQIYGNIDDRFSGIESEKTSWFANLELLGQNGGLYYSYIFADILSKNAIIMNTKIDMKLIFSKGHNEEIGKILFDFLYESE